MKYHTIGTMRQVARLKSAHPDLTLSEIEDLLGARAFTRWYRKNKKVVNLVALATPGVIMAAIGTPALDIAVPVSTAAPATGGFGFFEGQGVILLHMLIVGFLTLVVTTFLKFTGRGDLAPLVVFVGGGVILYEVIGLFNLIYEAVASFLVI